MNGNVEITVDAKALTDRINGMIAKLDHFRRVDIGMGLSEWQTDDMNRDRPFTMRSRAKGLATTKVRPHSLGRMKLSLRHQKRFARARKRYEEKWLPSGRKRRRRKPAYVVLAERPHRQWSTRSILRSQLVAQLKDRMDYLLRQLITWEKTSVERSR